jgi:hypothetical protein
VTEDNHLDVVAEVSTDMTRSDFRLKALEGISVSATSKHIFSQDMDRWLTVVNTIMDMKMAAF